MTPLWRKVLAAIFRQAWRETQQTIADSNMLGSIRRDRPRSWWIAIMANPSDKRHRGETKRARKGPVRMWEDTMEEAMGAHWRSSMVACANRVEWQGISNKAIDTLISKWKLPNTALSSNDKKTYIYIYICVLTKKYLPLHNSS